MLQARAASRTGLSHAYRSRRPHLPAVLRHQSHVGSTPGPSARPLVQQRGLIGMFSRVTRLFGNPVVAGSEEGAPENLIPRDELGAALVAQDPKRRIRFHYPELFDGLDGSKEWSRNIRIRARMPVSNLTCLCTLGGILGRAEMVVVVIAVRGSDTADQLEKSGRHDTRAPPVLDRRVVVRLCVQ